MARLKSYRPTAPMVINLIALFIVLGGQAIAVSGHGRVDADDLAKGSVTARNLAFGAVTKSKLARHAITDAALGSRVVTGRVIEPGVVRGQNLAGTFQVPAQVPDADPIEDSHWTTSTTGTATCPSDARLLDGGIVIQTSPFQKAFIQSTFPSSSNASTWVGEISTDTGGASPALLYAHCLR
jgi:hypothetical protein